MNKKYSIIVAIAIFFSTVATKALTPEELANYEAIKSALKSGDYNQNSVQITADIVCIEKHIQEQQKLINDWQMYLVPFFFKLFGTGFGLTAGLGVLATTVGAFGTMAMIGPGAYKELLWFIYSRTIPEELGVISRDTEAHKDFALKFRQKLSPNPLINPSKEEIVFPLFVMGAAAPALGSVSAISAVIARYLLNKAIRYKNEIARLEKEIEEDRVYVEELKRKLPVKDNE